MSAFKLVTIGVFLLLIIGGVLTFARLGSSSNTGPGAQVTIWGTLPQGTIDNLIRQINSKSATINAQYVEKNSTTFDTDLVNSLAEGTGPDIILIPESKIAKDQNKIFTIPFANYPERTFKDTFISEGELFLTSTGVLGVPFSIDPLVMYWNRDIFSTAGIASPPLYWSSLPDLAPKIVQTDQQAHLTRALIALGEMRNVTHSKDILSSLFFQLGDPIVVRDVQTGTLISVIDQKNDVMPALASSVLDFYTQFADPTNPYYTWSRALPSSRDAFLAGNLALYIGRASETSLLHNKNPNLNFDIAQLPQASAKSTKVTYGELTAFAITKSSKNISGSLSTILQMTSAPSITFLSDNLNLPPVRRDLLTGVPSDANQSIFYQSALQSIGWYDPDPIASDAIFQNMVESVSTNARHSTDAISSARTELQDAFK